MKLVVPVPPVKMLPPDTPAYQSIVSPAAGLAAILTVPVPHPEPLPDAGARGELIVMDELLTSLPPELETVTVPDEAFAGILTVIEVAEFTVNVGALAPFIDTDVTLLKDVPVILNVPPGQPLALRFVMVGIA